MVRRIKKAFVDFVSLCKRGANRLPTLYKSDDGEDIELVTLSKFDEDNGELLTCVYAPNHIDSDEEFANAETIKDASYGWMAKGAALDIKHNGKKVPIEKAFVAENFIIQATDERFHGWQDNAGNDVDLTGGWGILIKINDPELRRLYRTKEWDGVSMGGEAIRTTEKEDGEEPTWFRNFANAFLTKTKNKDTDQEDDMDSKTLEKALGEQFKPLNDKFDKLIDVLTKNSDNKEKDGERTENRKSDDKPTKPVYRGKPDDEKALKKFERELLVYEVRKEADLSTAEGVRSYQEAMSELKKTFAEEDAEEKEKVRKSSNQTDSGEGDGEDDTDDTEDGDDEQEARAIRKQAGNGAMLTVLRKSDEKLLKAGADAGKALRKSAPETSRRKAN